jgi:hypothetical protein
MEHLTISTLVKRCLYQFGFNEKPKLGWQDVTCTPYFPSRPRFEELPLGAGHPKASAWGLWGQSDERGTLNLITPEVVILAREEIKLGQIVSLK